MARYDLCTWANTVGQRSWRDDAPVLTPDSGAATILRWMEWHDRNGEWVGDDPPTADEAWDALAEVRECAER